MVPKILVVDDNQELLSLLTQLFEEGGYQVLGAGKGRQALDLGEEHLPSLAVLDVLLPDMMGYAVAEGLRKLQPGLPIIFITGVFRGGKHASEAQAKYRALGYFEKPFDANVLLRLVQKTVPPGAQEVPPSVDDPFDVELDVDVEQDEPLEAMELTGRIKVSGGGNLSAEIRGANLTAAPVTPGKAAVFRPAPPGTPALAGPTRATDPKSRRGELRDNLPALITAFYTAKETGELGCQRGQVKKIIYFEKGQPVYALSNMVSDRFGEFLVRVGKLKPDQLRQATAAAEASKKRLGDVLIERGLLKDTERLYYVAQQVKAIIYSLFGWEDGSYVLNFKDRVSAESIKLDIHPANLIIRGVKKLYKAERLRRLLHPEDRLMPSNQPSFPLEETERERWETDLMPKIDGTRTLAELQAMANRPEHVVYGFLYAMMAINILDRPGSGTTARA